MSLAIVFLTRPLPAQGESLSSWTTGKTNGGTDFSLCKHFSAASNRRNFIANCRVDGGGDSTEAGLVLPRNFLPRPTGRSYDARRATVAFGEQIPVILFA